MPSVISQSETSASEILFSQNIIDISTVERPSLGPPGTVLDQLPRAGTEVTGPVTLFVSVPLPPMPDLLGTRVGDARQLFEEWGVTLREEVELTTERPDGEIVMTTPGAGDAVGDEVVVIVAVSPVVGQFDTDIALVEKGEVGPGSPQKGPIEINGELFEDSLFFSSSSSSTDPGDFAYWEYNLSRDWETLVATIGLGDGSEFEQGGRFRILVDGNQIFERDLVFGQDEQVSINVSGALRLRLEAVALGNGRVQVVWGAPKLLGIPGLAG